MSTTNESESRAGYRVLPLKSELLDATCGERGASIVTIKCKRCGKEIRGYYSQLKNRRYCDAKCRVEPFQDRFWRKVDKTVPNGCWLWTACKNVDGYGSFPCEELQEHRAHRISWILANGPIPAGSSVLHKCPTGENPSCVNPDHLYLGTQTDNMQDTVAAGTHFSMRGEAHANSLLDAAAIREIRMNYNRITVKELASRFNVTIAAVRDVAKGRSWQCVSPKNYWEAQGITRLTRRDNARNFVQ